MKRKLLATLALTLSVSVLSSCTRVIQFPERATDPNVPIWQEPQSEAPSDPAALLGIWRAQGASTVYRFSEGGVLTVWGLTAGYENEYSNTATGSYTYDGETLQMIIGEEKVEYDCRVKDGKVVLEGDITMEGCETEPTAHPTYPFPDFEALAADLPLLSTDALIGQTLSAEGKRLWATVQVKSTYWSGKTMEKLTVGTAALGDTVSIDYVGKLNGTAFDGGSAKDARITVAPDTGYIPGFCEGVAGHAVGETFDVTVTFPETYKNTELAGKEVVFTMTLNAIYDTTLTDEMVAGYKENDYTTVAAWEQAVYEEKLAELIPELLPCMADYVDPTDAYRYFYQYHMDFYHYYAAYYGMSFEQFVAYAGITQKDLEEDGRATAKNYLLAALAARALSLTPDAEWVENFTQDYLTSYTSQGYTEAEAREAIATGDGKNQYRAELLREYVYGYLVSNNTFTD